MTDCDIKVKIIENVVDVKIVENVVDVEVVMGAVASETPFSAGFMDYIEPTLVGDGSIIIPSVLCRLYKNSTFDYKLDLYQLEGKTFASIPDNSVSYIVGNYNSGTPELQNITDVELITESDIVPYVTIYRQGNAILFLSWDEMAKGLANKLHQRLVKTNRFARQSGLLLSEHTERFVDISAGKTYNGVTRIENGQFDSETGIFKEFKHVAGSWVETILTQYDNTYYDDGTDLVEMLPNKYSVRWIYRGQQENPFAGYVFGSGEYTSVSLADAELPPSELPASISSFGILVGKIIIKKSATSGVVLSRDWSGGFQSAPVDMTPAGNNGEVQFNDGGIFGADGDFVYDKANNRVGIGTTTPSQQLDIAKSMQLVATTNANKEGIIYKAGVPFIHNFNYGDNGKVTTRGFNTFIGVGAGNFTMGATATIYYNSSNHTCIGNNAGKSITTAHACTLIGDNAGVSVTSGVYNLCLGAYAGANTKTGQHNCFLGGMSGGDNVTGSFNITMGTNAGRTITGNNNMAIGAYAGYNNKNTYENMYLGYYAGYSHSVGHRNTFVGSTAGRYTKDGSLNTRNSNNLYLGARTRSFTGNHTNENVFGYYAIGNGSNSVTLGSDSIIKTILKGNVGIGTITPKSKLDVNGGVKIANDTDTASIDKVGTIRYRADTNNSYVEMCMQTGASTYAREIIKTNTR